MPIENKPSKGNPSRSVKKVRTMEPQLMESDSILPPVLRGRLLDLFGMIEREFEQLYAENLSLHEKIEILTERLDQSATGSSMMVGIKEEGDSATDGNTHSQVAQMINKTAGMAKKSTRPGSQISQRIKSTYKTSTNKIVSSFKTSSYSFNVVKEFVGHRDGVWEVSVPKIEPRIVGTASADHTACIWWIPNGVCLVQYLGHTGSVNSVRFHPLQTDLVLTSSGDQKAHIWRSQVNTSLLESSFVLKNKNSSEEELDTSMEKDETEGQMNSPEDKHEPIVIHQSNLELLGHTGVVIAADWLAGGSHVITASWDRVANMYDSETGALINSLTGHDQELTNVSVHPTQKLVMTSSKDTTFRLWDLREPSMKVNVFQGHTQPVTTAVFAGGDCLVSGSDDRSIKIWDLKNLRSPTTTIRMDSGVNRLSISSSSNLIAVPMDNCNIRLYDLSGTRHGRVPKISKGHSHMVSCAAWNESAPSASSMTSPISNLLTCGFDRHVFGWSVCQQAEK